jgi:DNA-binding beta-propeller fold protein YncE
MPNKSLTTYRGYPGPAAVLVTVLLLAVSACSSSPKPGAAEPATAPPLAVRAAGTATRVGDGAEGLAYDPTTGLLAVAVRRPDRLLLLDGATMAVRRTVALPGSVRHLQLAAPGGPVLVPIESANEIGEVSLPSGSLRTTRVEKQPHDAAAASNDVVVGNEFGRSLSFVRNGKVIKTVRDVRQPGGVIADGGTVAVIDVARFTLGTYDVATMTRTARVAAGRGPTHGVLVSGNRLVVADTRGDAVLVFSVDPLRQISRLHLSGTPYGMAVDGNTVWVTLTARNQVVAFDVSGTTPREIARYDTVRQPNTVAVAPGSHTLWITGTASGTVERITR